MPCHAATSDLPSESRPGSRSAASRYLASAPSTLSPPAASIASISSQPAGFDARAISCSLRTDAMAAKWAAGRRAIDHGRPLARMSGLRWRDTSPLTMLELAVALATVASVLAAISVNGTPYPTHLLVLTAALGVIVLLLRSASVHIARFERWRSGVAHVAVPAAEEAPRYGATNASVADGIVRTAMLTPPRPESVGYAVPSDLSVAEEVRSLMDRADAVLRAAGVTEGIAASLRVRLYCTCDLEPVRQAFIDWAQGTHATEPPLSIVGVSRLPLGARVAVEVDARVHQ